MNCPKCENVEMTVETAGEVEVDRCGSCHGVWLDALELEKLIETAPKSLLSQDKQFHATPGEEGPRLTCPNCKGTPLIKLNSRLRPGTIIDSCTVCFGTWLDAGELTRLANPDLITRIKSLFRG